MFDLTIFLSVCLAKQFLICSSFLLTDKINNALKSAARTITRTRLKDKVRSDIVLQKAGQKSLNEMVAYSSAIMVWN